MRQQAWSIAEVARECGLTTRTLRHYDAIGLVKPAFTDANGWRYYERPELARLQQVLLLRRLGMPLASIAAVLDHQSDERAALRRHRTELLCERDRLDRLIASIDRTLEGTAMTPQTMFDGFDDPYEAEARQRYGDAAVDATHERMRGWSAEDADLARTGYARVHAALAELQADGVPADDPRVQDVIASHYETTCRFWTPDAAAYRGLGETYVQDERFRRSIGDGLVEYLRDAMAVYADGRLG